MKTFTASGLGRLALAALACASPGCAGVDSPPPRPPVDLSAIKESLEGLRRGMRDQERRIEGAREEVQRLGDAFARAREELESEREEARDSLEKAGKIAAGLEARIGKLESRVSLLRASASRADARKEGPVAGPAGAPSRMAPVGAPLADARIASVGLPEDRDAPVADLPARGRGGPRGFAGNCRPAARLRAPAHLGARRELRPGGSRPARGEKLRAGARPAGGVHREASRARAGGRRAILDRAVLFSGEEFRARHPGVQQGAGGLRQRGQGAGGPSAGGALVPEPGRSGERPGAARPRDRQIPGLGRGERRPGAARIPLSGRPQGPLPRA